MTHLTLHNDENRLCYNCSKVDLKALFTGDRYPHTPFQDLRIYVNHLNSILAIATCPLCRLLSFAVTSRNLSSLISSSSLDPSDIDVYLEPWRADTAEGVEFFDPLTQDLTATSLVIHLALRSGAENEELENFNPVDIKLFFSEEVCKSRPLLNGKEIFTPTADFGVIKEWIGMCRERHEICRNSDEELTSIEDDYRGSFRLIDVKKRIVVQHDPLDTDFAALSYVWGYSQDQYATVQKGLAGQVESEIRTLPVVLPRTIEDAMTVCGELGLEYLWVDLFCVDQCGTREQGVQLRNMGNTYQRAAITIVSAFGEDSEAGLPGIQEYKISPLQHRERVEGLELITGLPTLSDQMNESKWGTRGWTFQEGLLSTRCLIFGGYEPLLFCRLSLSRGSLHPSPHDPTIQTCPGRVYSLTMGQLEHFPISTPVFHLQDKSQEWEFGDYAQIVKGYLLRDVTRPSDTLAALTGYLSLVTQYTGVRFLWGLPVHSLVDGIAWFGRCYSWNRIESMPSWAWAGWGLSWHNWPFFEAARYEASLLSFDELSFQDSLLPTSIVHLSGDDYPARWPAQRVLQTPAKIEVCEGTEGKRLKLSSYVARFVLIPLNPEEELVYDGPEDAPIITPPLTLIGSNELPVPIPAPANEYERRNGDLNKFALSMPYNMSVETFEWVIGEKMEFVMLKRWEQFELKEGQSGKGEEEFRFVLAMLIDRRAGNGVARRIGIMAIPSREWDLAGPKMETVFLE